MITEMEQLEPKGRARQAEQRLVGLEADVAPGVEVVADDALGQGRDRRVIGRGGKVARPFDDVGETEGRRLFLGEDG